MQYDTQLNAHHPVIGAILTKRWDNNKGEKKRENMTIMKKKKI